MSSAIVSARSFPLRLHSDSRSATTSRQPAYLLRDGSRIVLAPVSPFDRPLHLLPVTPHDATRHLTFLQFQCFWPLRQKMNAGSIIPSNLGVLRRIFVEGLLAEPLYTV